MEKRGKKKGDYRCGVPWDAIEGTFRTSRRRRGGGAHLVRGERDSVASAEWKTEPDKSVGKGIRQ